MGGKRFPQTLHVKSNSGKSPFCCEVCENSLRNNLNVKNTHTEEKQCHCQVCWKCFTQTLYKKKTGKSPCQRCKNILREIFTSTHTHRRETISLSSVWKVFHTYFAWKNQHRKESILLPSVWKLFKKNLYIKTHTQKRNHIIAKSVQSVSQKVCMKEPAQERIHFVVKCVKTV